MFPMEFLRTVRLEDCTMSHIWSPSTSVANARAQKIQNEKLQTERRKESASYSKHLCERRHFTKEKSLCTCTSTSMHTNKF